MSPALAPAPGSGSSCSVSQDDTLSLQLSQVTPSEPRKPTEVPGSWGPEATALDAGAAPPWLDEAAPAAARGVCPWGRLTAALPGPPPGNPSFPHWGEPSLASPALPGFSSSGE